MNYEELVKALRGLANGTWKNCEYTWFGGEEKVFADAAAAIEDLQAQLPKRGEWYTELYDGDKKYQCSNCLTHWDVETRYCPFCGAKMNDSNASNALNALDNAQDGPIITPCRGCSDYDGYGGCKSKGGCAREKMVEAHE